ncbi:MAG: calcium/sodium antiporter [Gemmatimonadales bacterium]
MGLSVAVGLVLLGLVLLAGGGDLLVRGATSIARMAGLTPAVIGLTVVALGTSLPELVVSMIASIDGQPDLAVGNAVGSNLFNITVILGIAAVVARLPVRGSVVRLEWPVMFLACVLCILVSRDGIIDRLEAGSFLTALVVFIAYSVHLARREVTADEAAGLEAEVAHLTIRPPRVEAALAAAATIGGVAMLVLGGKALVDGSVQLAQAAGMSERFIGLTVVAAGTSAPELATSVVAALRKQSDIAIANLIGSNIFNVFGILGAAGLLLPLRVAPGLLHNDMPWMVGTAVLLFVLMVTRRVLSRPEGLLLLVAYGVYFVRLVRH